ncbi:MAG TPA: hypothetical protein PK253_05535 [Spirochaetota bacterium]|nr:hypothetical protein [Spirochaetota bacterium]
MKTARRSIQIFTDFGKDMALVAGGTLLSFGIVQFLTLLVIKTKTKLLFDYTIFIQFFSMQMVPTIIAYGVLITTIYYLYQKAKSSIMKLNDQEIQREREKAIVQTSQKLTSMMVEYISSYNNEIKSWIQHRNEKGQQPPVKIVNASDKIGKALKVLSELSFLMPYGSRGHYSIEDYSAFLEQNLRKELHAEPLLIEDRYTPAGR